LLILELSHIELAVVGVVALSLSYLLNGLFSRRKWHFYIVAAACLSIVPAMLFWKEAIPISLLAIIIAVPLEALYILVGALWQRLPGARIIGGGLLLLIGLLLVVLGLIFVQGDVYLDDSTLAGQIFLSVLVLAILSIPISMSMYLAWRFATVNRNLKTQLEQVETLSAKARQQEAERQRLLETRQEELEREVALRTEELRRQKKKSDDLLLNILPAEIAEELKENGSSTARLYDNVTVLFTDFVDFTQHSVTLSPTALVAEIDECFRAFDDIIGRHGLEKIKTVGDAYIAVSGMPAANRHHARDVVRAGLEIKAFMENRRQRLPKSFGIRLGVHSGPVVAGIVGVKKFAYDIWGDTVNTAARMEQHSAPGKLNISEATYGLVKGYFTCTLRGELEVKHKGRMNMYFVEDGDGR
jgi:class 3 adenylate cyclase